MTKKLRYIIFGIILLVVSFGTFSSSKKTSQPSQPEVQEQRDVTFSIDYGNEDTLVQTLSLSEDSTPYSLLMGVAEENNIELKVKEYDFGVFVESVKGVEGSANMAWIYFVNGESGQVAADKHELNTGDKVEWKYISPN